MGDDARSLLRTLARLLANLASLAIWSVDRRARDARRIHLGQFGGGRFGSAELRLSRPGQSDAGGDAHTRRGPRGDARAIAAGVAGLGGMALALLMVALVVQHAKAASACSVCQSVKIREASNGACKGLDGPGHGSYEWQYCVQQYMMTACYGGNPSVCSGPGNDSIKTLTDCGSDACRFTASPKGICSNDDDAGDICSNSCLAQPCATLLSNSSCAQVPAKQKEGGGYPAPSTCATKCGCQ